MKKRLDVWRSIQIAKRPGLIVLLTILIINVVFVLISAGIISLIGANSGGMGFLESIYRTITIMFDAGCVDNVIESFETASFLMIIVCLLVVILGMVMFTGAVIGYITNYISSFIDNANSGSHKLILYNHTIILNWNSRASEIVNDLLYSESKETIVVLASSDKERIESEIRESIQNTLGTERRELLENAKKMGLNMVQTKRYLHKNLIKNKLTIIVRQGETYATTQLYDVSVDKAKAVIILGNDVNSSMCKYEVRENLDNYSNGNSNIIKNLVQVADITGQESSADNQRIIVEVEDDWTFSLVQKVIEHKQRLGKCNIYAVPVNKVLGQILSQFSIMPELNIVYKELFSNKGSAFYSKTLEDQSLNENSFISDYMKTHSHAVPVATMNIRNKLVGFYVSDKANNLNITCEPDISNYSVKYNKEYWMEKKSIIILGHNSESGSIMEGFDSFIAEWSLQDGSEIINIIVIDDAKNLEKNNYYRDRDYVTKVIEAEIYEKDKICDAINEFVDSHAEDTSVLILSDDRVATENLDACVMTYLLYVQDIISEHIKQNPQFDRESIDVIAEILNPKNYEVVRSYNVSNIVISNRYISKMITQISEKDDLFEFYTDILTYDVVGADSYESKELYIKPVCQFFDEIPAPCTAAQMIRAIYAATPDNNKSVAIGTVSPNGVLNIWGNNQNKTRISVNEKDKLIIFSNH